jgi:hypothetical protein
MPVTTFEDLPVELQIKIAEDIQDRRDFLNFSRSGSAPNNAARNAFANNLGLTMEQVHVLREIFGKERAEKLVRELTHAEDGPSSHLA